MNVYVVTETTPSEMGDTTSVVGVFRKRADAVARVRRLFEDELEGREWDEYEHPESFTDVNGGVLGDLTKDSDWIYWDITTSFVV